MRTDGEIGVILLRSMAGSGVGRHVLGATRSRDARNATVWVYFDEVASTLGLAGRPDGIVERDASAARSAAPSAGWPPTRSCTPSSPSVRTTARG